MSPLAKGRVIKPLRVLIVTAAAALALLAGFGQPTYAATITVNNPADNLTRGDGRCTLREAIENAPMVVIEGGREKKRSHRQYRQRKKSFSG